MTRLSDMSGEQLQQVLDVLSGADSVELKLTLVETKRAGWRKRLGIDPLEAELRQVFFLDTKDLALNGAGVVVRVRRRQGEKGDTVVKIRPVDPASSLTSFGPIRGSAWRLTLCPGAMSARRRRKARPTMKR